MSLLRSHPHCCRWKNCGKHSVKLESTLLRAISDVATRFQVYFWIESLSSETESAPVADLSVENCVTTREDRKLNIPNRLLFLYTHFMFVKSSDTSSSAIFVCFWCSARRQICCCSLASCCAMNENLCCRNAATREYAKFLFVMKWR